MKLCQMTRQSQFAVSRLFWFIAALDGFYRAETLLSSLGSKPNQPLEAGLLS
jgi:hypothetical protein